LVGPRLVPLPRCFDLLFFSPRARFVASSLSLGWWWKPTFFLFPDWGSVGQSVLTLLLYRFLTVDDHTFFFPFPLFLKLPSCHPPYFWAASHSVCSCHFLFSLRIVVGSRCLRIMVVCPIVPLTPTAVFGPRNDFYFRALSSLSRFWCRASAHSLSYSSQATVERFIVGLNLSPPSF